jgi:putative iron-only hydrogenase system regulator
MKTCVAMMGIIVENYTSVDALNDILHENRNYIIGRLGVPLKEKKISVMSIIVDSDSDHVEKMVTEISKLDGVRVNVINS